MLNLAESGKQIGEKLFALLTVDQKKELTQYVLENETGSLNLADNLYLPIFRGKYSIPKKVSQPLTEVREGDLYFCLEQRLVTVRGQVIELTVKEFEIFSLLILNPKRVFTYEMLMDLVWNEDYTYYSRKAVNNHVSNLRKKLKVAPDLPDYVKSVYGIGYKFDCS
ncbi:MAG: helix-turn-helix domain-containing protein [Christensenellaceae bacterium]